MSMNSELYSRVREQHERLMLLESQVRDLSIAQTGSTPTYIDSIIKPDYSHKHKPSALLDGSAAANIIFSGTITVPEATVTAHEGAIDHDALTNFLANEHIDWTSTASNLNTSGTATLSGVVQIGAVRVNLANGTTYYLDSDGDVFFKHLNVNNQINNAVTNTDSGVVAINYTGYQEGTTKFRDFDVYDGKNTWLFNIDGSAKNINIKSCSLLMDGTGTDDDRIAMPYLAQAPFTLTNGSIWMEADGLHGYLSAAERNLSRPHCLDSYLDIKTRQSVWDIHGGIESISTANALDSVPTDITDTIGLGKIIVVINAGGDVTGEITVTGTTVDRDTGAETGADTETLTVDTLTTDNSGTDAGGNVTYAFINAYMTTKWFKGAVTLSTTNLTLTDVDIYQCSFEQFNDLPNVMVDTIDTNQLANNAAANIYWHLYSVKPSGDKVTLAKEVSMELTAADVAADKHYRLRRGNLAISIDGTTEGIFVQCYPEPLASLYWEDINLKIWYY